MSTLALLGGRKAVSAEEDLFSWPVVTPRMEAAVLEVLRKGKISDLDITVDFEKEFARWLGVITIPDIKAGAGIPWGGYKYRLNQLCSAIGREQLKNYGAQMAEIDEAMSFFWDRLEELGGLSISRFCAALRAEGVRDCQPGCNLALHTHPLFYDLDVYGDGKPTNAAESSEAAKRTGKNLRVSAGIQSKVFKVPWFRRYRTEAIGQHVEAFRKVVESYRELLADDPGDPETLGGWGTSSLIASR
jgi:dTDP-4-amino-4,6-dideoxygalactose transaminase